MPSATSRTTRCADECCEPRNGRGRATDRGEAWFHVLSVWGTVALQASNCSFEGELVSEAALVTDNLCGSHGQFLWHSRTIFVASYTRASLCYSSKQISKLS